MAKTKVRPSKKFQLPSLKSCDDRLRTLSWELSLAGAEVLQEHFGFTKEQSAKWLDLMIERAKENRSKNQATVKTQT